MEKLSVLAVSQLATANSGGTAPRKIQLVFVNVNYNKFSKPVEKKTVLLAWDIEEIKGLHPPLLAWLKLRTLENKAEALLA